jgi:hypothetical protein
MTRFITKYFGHTRNLIAFLIGAATFALLFGTEMYLGHSNNGSSGFLIGFGLCWLLVVK